MNNPLLNTTYQPFEPQLREFIQKTMRQDAAHDIHHVLRVVSNAKALAIAEGANLDIVVPAAYMHDCFTYPKDHPQRSQSSVIAGEKAVDYLKEMGYPKLLLPGIKYAIEAHSFSAGIAPRTLEAQVVQDADRLDALGAIGIARCLQVSTSFGAALYHSDDPFASQRELNDKQFTVDHFYTKLLKLQQQMTTASARQEAAQRSDYMREFLQQLGREIDKN